MPADMRCGLHCEWYYRMRCWCAEYGIVLAQPMQCFGSSDEWCCGHMHIEAGLGLGMPADMQCRVHSVWEDKLQCWGAHSSEMLAEWLLWFVGSCAWKQGRLHVAAGIREIVSARV